MVTRPLTRPQPIYLGDIRCDFKGLTSLGAFAQALLVHRNSFIFVDCSLSSWVDANLSAALEGLVRLARNQGTFVEFVGFKPIVKQSLSRIGLLATGVPDKKGTVIRLQQFNLSDGKLFARFADTNLQGKGIPKMSEGLRIAFLQGVNELFNNCVLHSRSPTGVFACGQSYPKRLSLDFSVVDMGEGFQSNVSRFLGYNLTACDAIDWAMQDDNTTRSGDIPGGLGLKIIRDFVALNRGCLTICSAGGYWSQTGEEIQKREMRTNFPGTIVTLKINTSDSSSYRLKNEPNPNDLL